MKSKTQKNLMKRGCECFMPCVKDGWIDGCEELKASESSSCEWNVEDETKLVEKDFRPNTYFFIGM